MPLTTCPTKRNNNNTAGYLGWTEILGQIIGVLKWNSSKYGNEHDLAFARQNRYHDHTCLSADRSLEMNNNPSYMRRDLLIPLLAGREQKTLKESVLR